MADNRALLTYRVFDDPVDLDLLETITFDDVQIRPEYSEIESRSVCSVKTQLTQRINLPTPLLAAPMDSVCGHAMMTALMDQGAAGCLHRFMDIDAQISILNEVRDFRRRMRHLDAPLIASIGAVGDYQQRAEACVDAGADILLIDVAHGDHIHVKHALEWLNKLSYRSKFDVIAGNITEVGAAKRLEDWGADALRVGIGGGSMCETRIRTGVGVPQLTAIIQVASVASIPVIADGAIRYPGDVAKALAAGADTVMLGSLFAGTDEAPGDVFVTGQWPNEKATKVFRGSASASAKTDAGKMAEYIEGASHMVACKGSVWNVVRTILDGVRSSMSYVGARTLEEFRTKAHFIRVTGSGQTEAHPHGLK
jgi:IMP dehydrogenase